MERDDLRILDIEHVTMDDSGLYRITLENEYGRIETTARLDVICNRRRTTRLQRAVSASPRRPYHWTRRLRGNSTAIGGRLALASDIRGKSLPPTTRRFYCNGEEVQESDRVRIVDLGVGFATQLVIEPVLKSDEGVYMCIAEFASVNDSDPIVLVSSTDYLMFDDQKISDDHDVLLFRNVLPREITVEEGVEIDLLCEVDSSGAFEYTWWKDGNSVPNGEDFQFIDHGNGVLCLRLSDPFLLDSGSYTCVITNESGDQIQTSCTLSVTETVLTSVKNARPEFIKLPQAVFTRSGADITIECRIEPADSDLVWIVNGHTMTNELDGVAVSGYTFD